jgi:citrate/tricarballylate utilization protein
MSIDEAEWQLGVCNACRYCEGICAVFPAIERSPDFGPVEVAYLANLCHDCRACLDACMYSPPHEFGVDIPDLLTRARQDSYEHYIPPPRFVLPIWLPEWARLLAVFLFTGGLIAVVSAITLGLRAFVPHTHAAASPYIVVPYAALVVLGLAPGLWTIWVMARAALRYWRDIAGPLPRLRDMNAVIRAFREGATLKYMRGGGGGCTVSEEDDPSPWRRRAHFLASYGFFACLLSTISAAVLQDIAGERPPYSLLSVPVVLGLAGGIGMVLGSTGLIAIRHRGARKAADAPDALATYAFPLALDALSVTGILTLALRNTPAFGIVLIVHLATVLTCISFAPYSKFVHFVYRLLSLTKDALETSQP